MEAVEKWSQVLDFVGGFSDDWRGVPAGVRSPTLVGVELVFDGGLSFCNLPIGIYRKLRIAVFANS
jgi:hypothetical protein